MDSASPDEMLRAAAVHDEAGRSASLVDWRRQTRREVVSITYTNFDPLGLLLLLLLGTSRSFFRS